MWQDSPDERGKGSNRSNEMGIFVHAPFNFVPLSTWILRPDWSSHISQDKPLSDGVSGILDIKITANTPLLVGDEQNKQSGTIGQVNFNKLPDGRYAIPGTSLRGMLRNVLEIATFSGMRIVEDQRFSVRDLSNKDLYQKKMSEEHEGKKKVYKAKSLSGWLCFEDKKWKLYPCKHYRIDFQDIKGPENKELLKKNFRSSSKEKYEILKKVFPAMKVRFAGEEEKKHDHSNGNKLIYAKAQLLNGKDEGYLVVTGQPGPKKHMEFIFKPPGVESLALPEKVVQDFLFIHKDTQEWKYLNGQSPFPKEVGIPVFYLEDNKNTVVAMGLAQMFKLAYTYSIHDMINHTQKNLEENGPDFVEALFGRVSSSLEKTIKSRVSIDYAVCSNPTPPQPQKQFSTILSSPKPSYYPIYVKQDGQKGNSTIKTDTYDEKKYKTYNDEDAEISGWKRYPVKGLACIPPLEGKTANAGNDVKVELHPLPSGTTFVGKVRFHNLKPEELGSIIWGLEWGGDTNKCHSLGMGKPFGFGSISIKIEGSQLIPNNLNEGKPKTLDEYRDVFVKYMEEKYRASLVTSKDNGQNLSPFAELRKLGLGSTSWQNSPEMKQLFGMADPENSKNKNLSYMKLGESNEFLAAKKKKDSLKPYI